MISMLDDITVAYMGMIASILMAAAMILNWQVQKLQQGMALWALAYASGALGIILIGFRSTLTPVISIVLANVFFRWIYLHNLDRNTPVCWQRVGGMVDIRYIGCRTLLL